MTKEEFADGLDKFLDSTQKVPDGWVDWLIDKENRDMYKAFCDYWHESRHTLKEEMLKAWDVRNSPLAQALK